MNNILINPLKYKKIRTIISTVKNRYNGLDNKYFLKEKIYQLRKLPNYVDSNLWVSKVILFDNKTKRKILSTTFTGFADPLYTVLNDKYIEVLLCPYNYKTHYILKRK